MVAVIASLALAREQYVAPLVGNQIYRNRKMASAMVIQMATVWQTMLKLAWKSKKHIHPKYLVVK